VLLYDISADVTEVVVRLIRERRDLDDEGALADYTEAIARDPEYADAYYLRAALRYDLGDAEAGQADYVRALQLDSTSANALYLSGRVEISLGDEVAGLDAYDKALRIDPNHGQAYYSRGVYKANQNDIQAPSPTTPRRSRPTRSLPSPTATGPP
jgi:tetratricopeptide (TPR) repeat protein